VEQRRKEKRFKPSQNATLKVLGLRPGPVIQVGVLDISGNGMRLHSKLPVACGTPVEIEVNDTVAQGSVCRCLSQQGSYELGVQLSETAAKSLP
jgi:hypothetical protein